MKFSRLRPRANPLKLRPGYASDFHQHRIGLVPSDDLLKSFHENAEPMFRQKHLLQLQSKHLKRTRDLLLPRLISGKFPVEDLDIQFPPGMAEELNAGLSTTAATAATTTGRVKK